MPLRRHPRRQARQGFTDQRTSDFLERLAHRCASAKMGCSLQSDRLLQKIDRIGSRFPYETKEIQRNTAFMVVKRPRIWMGLDRFDGWTDDGFVTRDPLRQNSTTSRTEIQNNEI